MSRSFEGFMLGYCQRLTGLRTSSLKRLAGALPSSPRAEEPLLLLAIAQGREGYLVRCAPEPAASRYRRFLDGLAASGEGLGGYLASLPEGDRYAKAYRAWVSERGALARDRETLRGVGEAMSAMIERSGMTRAEACRAAGVDKGNFYAFLKGDASRLGRETAMRAYRAVADACGA